MADEKELLGNEKNVIILIGKSQVGKTTLINFIRNGVKWEIEYHKLADNKKIGDGFTSCTSAFEAYKFENLIMVDTPGLSDSGGTDLETIIQLINLSDELIKLQYKIKYIMLVVNHEEMITGQKDITKALEVYKVIFGSILDTAMAIVFNRIDTIPITKAEKINRDKLEKKCNHIVNEIRVIMELKFVPDVIRVNCMPEDNSLESNLQMIESWFKEINKRPSQEFIDYKIPKSQYMIEKNREEAKRLRIEIYDIEKARGEYLNNEGVIGQNIDDCERRTIILNREIRDLNNDISVMNTSSMINVGTFTVDCDWKMLGVSKIHNYQSPYILQNENFSDLTGAFDKILEASGTVNNEYLYRLQFSKGWFQKIKSDVTVRIMSRVFNSQNILNKQNRIDEAKQEILSEARKLQTYIASNEVINEKLNKFREDIQALEDKIINLESPITTKETLFKFMKQDK